MTRSLLFVGLAAAVGCTADVPRSKTAPTAAPPTKAADPTPDPAPTSGGGNTNYQAGAGALQNTRQAARRTVALNDLANLGKFIQAQEIELGKMPTKAEITNALKADPSYRSISAAVADGTIILTGTSNKSGLWAYETDADSKGGLGLVGGVASRYSADEIKRYLQGG